MSSLKTCSGLCYCSLSLTNVRDTSTNERDDIGQFILIPRRLGFYSSSSASRPYLAMLSAIFFARSLGSSSGGAGSIGSANSLKSRVCANISVGSNSINLSLMRLTVLLPTVRMPSIPLYVLLRTSITERFSIFLFLGPGRPRSFTKTSS